MFRTLSLLLISLLYLSVNYAGFAQDSNYQTEVSLTYSNTGFEDDDTIKSATLYASYYLKPVKTSGVPLAEAGFLSRAPLISAYYGQSKSEYNSSSILDSEGDRYGFYYSYVSPEHPFLFDITFDTYEYDYTRTNGTYRGSTSSDSYGINLGYFYDQQSAVQFEFLKADYSSKNLSLAYNSLDGIALAWKSVILNSDSTAWGLYASIRQLKVNTSNSSTSSSVRLLADYYFNQWLSLGGGLDYIDAESPFIGGKIYHLKGRYFLTSSFSIAASVSSYRLSDPTSKGKNISLQAAFRF